MREFDEKAARERVAQIFTGPSGDGSKKVWALVAWGREQFEAGKAAGIEAANLDACTKCQRMEALARQLLRAYRDALNVQTPQSFQGSVRLDRDLAFAAEAERELAGEPEKGKEARDGADRGA